jgi:hypothetical protein
VKGHSVKYQATYRKNDNEGGKSGTDSNEFFVQCQYVF